MKLNRCFDFHKGKRTYSISQAVAHTVTDDRNGVAETALASAIKIADTLGELVEALHESNVLSDKAVLALLPGFEQSEGS